MENKYFNSSESLFDITQKHPEVIDLFVSIGFENMKDPVQRELVGKSISLEIALKLKKINLEVFTDRLVEAIEQKKDASNMNIGKSEENTKADINIQGVLPCPVRIPLMESFSKWLEETEGVNKNVNYDLKAASVGVDWIKEAIENVESDEVISDIFISAGFDLFFDKKLMGKFKSKGVFKDLTGFEKLNTDFENEEISLRDPDGQYSLIGVVPAVFLINTEELNGREIPKTWDDIFKPEFKNSVSLPIGDFDLFNAIILNIYKKYGEEGIRNLGECLLVNMHPVQMVKSHMKKTSKPAVTIMPYFFTKMTKQNGPMTAIWPEDGAIISPIFLLSKKAKEKELKPYINFLASKQVGEILAHNGLFPSISPEVDNRIPKENKYMWLGWDFIKNNDIGELIKKCEKIFHESVGEGKI
ncbi:ABC-type Fe3+ transport system, substrate-binding protein [Desulfonispora thiosulfatigenes DSM 11270]|uniref:ABC-type Fe3+ transport system, substrate-binding protein n=1 Tax=Desulfonispora thiosulfatigenes DSM 11270 TaxID=656914 RepID=A0A1W1UJI9_DESTI|nr:ABC transporter substrate-binding protein [Desulfonispora thiosulfatigenes]SMB81212.1 ABC-type Fe3+ transport system, substrate-binding protein [Desulfonispora thiosulfatigenes DSM 11270]